MAAFQGTDRYVMLNYLGSGSFGEVYEVFDRERQTKIALKLPYETTAGGLYHFKREFRSLIDMVHPNLAALYELVGDRDCWFFTMELVPGVPFNDYLRTDSRASSTRPSLDSSRTGCVNVRAASGPQDSLDSRRTATGICLGVDSQLPPPAAEPLELPPCTPPRDYDAVRALLLQLAEGLTALHQAGKLHRDIKPSNVLVTAAGHLSILDFGLVVEATLDGREAPPATHLIGTPAYMAPEQMEGHRGTEASDWYSVGIMLYEVLTGRQPFSGSLLEILRGKLTEEIAPPSSRVPETPEDLEALCMKLLRHEASARPKGPEIIERLYGHLAPTLPYVPQPSTSTLPVLVGRGRELNALFDAFRRSSQSQPGLVQLHGGSGTGKTLLLKHFVHKLQQRAPEAVILQGRCYEQESVPYKAVDPLIDDLSRHLAHMPKRELESLVPRHGLALTRLFPVLNRIEALHRSASGAMDMDDAKTVRRRAILALRELLGRLCDRHPLVLIIDDLQWGDLDSAALLRELLTPPDPPPMLLVLCYRSEETASAPVLVELLAKPAVAFPVEITLKELSPGLSEALAITLITPGTPEADRLAKRIAQDSGGNPFFIGELAHHSQPGLLEANDLLENSLYGCIQQRVAALPKETQRIVETLALAGHPLSWEVVKRASGVEGANLPPASLLKAGRLIRTRSTSDQSSLEIYHDFVRRAVLASLGGNSRRSGHLRLAEVLEACGEGEPETLARHYILAGESRKASEFAARAGDKAAAAFAFKGAADLYRRSMDLRPLNDPVKPSLMLRFANVLSGAGLGKEAADIYLQLAADLEPPDRLRLQRRAAEEFFRSGHFDHGVETLKPVLVAIGIRLPSGVITAKLHAAYYALRLRIRGLGFSQRSPREIPPGELEHVDICWTAVQGLGTGALMRGMDLQIPHLLLALKVGDPSRIIRALAHQTLLESMQGSRSLARAQRCQTLSLSLAEKQGDPKLTGYAYMTAGIAAMLQGRWIPSCNLLEHAKEIYTHQCVGTASELHQVHHYLLSVHFVLGHFQELQRDIPALLRDAEERGDLLAEANLKTGYSLFHHLAADDPESARRKLARAREIWSSREFHAQHWQALYLGGLIDQYAGKPEVPWRLLAEQGKALEDSRLLDVQYIRLCWFEHKARTALAYAHTCSRTDRARKQAFRIARKAIRKVQREKTDYGHAAYLKLRGSEAAVSGRTDDAIRWFHEAQTVYEACHMPLHAHIAQWCRGTLMQEAGQELVREATAWMTEQGIVNPGRYATMHAPCVTVD